MSHMSFWSFPHLEEGAKSQGCGQPVGLSSQALQLSSAHHRLPHPHSCRINLHTAATASHPTHRCTHLKNAFSQACNGERRLG